MIKYNFTNQTSVQFNVITSVNCRDRIDVVNNTWGKYAENLFFYSDHDDVNNNVYKVSDNQRDCGLKTANRLKQLISNEIKYDWYFFVDDDTVVNFHALNNFITTHTPDRVYGHPAGNWTDVPYYQPYMQGGCGILIPGNVLKTINVNDIEDDWLYPASGYGDLWWSYIFLKKKIQLEPHREIFYSMYSAEEEETLMTKNLTDIISVHPVRGEERMRLYTGLLNPAIEC